MRIYQLAKELNLSSRRLIEILNELNIEVKSHMSTLDSDTAELVYEMIHEDKKAKEKEEVKKMEIKLPKLITVRELAKMLNVESSFIIKKLMDDGIMANINQELEKEVSTKIAKKLGYSIIADEVKEEPTIESNLISHVKSQGIEGKLRSRPPIVTVMGHVDHGKTSLLDSIRKAKVTASEAGGITQHIGAYQVMVEEKTVVFLDTPGHEAFTELRSRGAKVTDIAVLVVAADDGVMPQTVEAINHAKAADIPIIVAINKIDKPTANPEIIKQQLAEHELIPEDWGGDTVCVNVSAKDGTGIQELLEMIVLVAEMSELKAEYDVSAVGTIIEAQLDKGRGPVATLIVQKGTLNIGDTIVAGTSYGKVRAMIDDKGNRIEKALPSTPVEVLGLSEVPNAGDLLYMVNDDKLARQIAEKRKDKQKETELKMMGQKVTLDKLFEQIKKVK